MNRAQFRILYRQFLFRIVDWEVLSTHARGDASRLLGQFAALLVFISFGLSLGALLSVDPKAGPAGSPINTVTLWVTQHFLIATTMLVVGLFAVMSWDATFPDRRDVLVLAPLPVRARTMFLAKVAAVGSGLGLTIVLLHSLMGLCWPLAFAARARAATLPTVTFDPTPRPLSPGDLPSVMDRDLHQALTTGSLAPGTGAGLAIGVWKNGERRVLAYGAARPDSIFEIGSITKTFTGLILARMVADGKVRLDEPVRELLPAGTVAKRDGAEITLLDLVTHHSGLPRMPPNFRPADRANPYADYGTEQLYAYVAKRGLSKPADAHFRYSNIGVGLLGQALAVRAGRGYAELLREQITGPFGLADTAIQLSPDQQRRFIQGYDDQHRPVHAWDLDALAGAGAIRSTAGDLLTYLQANLHPERFAALAGPINAAHQPRNVAPSGGQIALAWNYAAASGTYRHGGATGGFTSYVLFNPQADYAVVVLMNSGPNLLLAPEMIGEHIRQRLAGEEALSLETSLVPVVGGFAGVLRSFFAYWLTMLAAGAFVYGAVLGLQGLAAQILPRQLFLRASGHLQTLAFCLIVGVYFLQPGVGGLDDLTAGSLWRVIHWLPSYWFLGLYQQLNGSMHPALEPLAARAWVGLAAVLVGTTSAYALSYWRTLRQIVEEPDILPSRHRRRWLRLPQFGSQTTSAIVQFSVRTLRRSRQHRMILAFYLGIGLAFISLLVKDPGTNQAFTEAGGNPWREASIPLWASTFMMMALMTIGTRVVFALPLDLHANWAFQIIGVRGGMSSLVASRRALLLLAVIPVWLVSAAVCWVLWPVWDTAVHLVVLGLVGLILAEICLMGFRKIPFSCSYLPGKSRFHMVLFGASGLFLGCIKGVLWERKLLLSPRTTAGMVTVLASVWIAIRLIAVFLAKGEEQELRFEEEEAPAVQGLGLDGAWAVPPKPTA